MQRPVLTISVDPTAQGPTLVFTGSKFIQNSITLKASFVTGPQAGQSAEMPVPADQDHWQLGTFTYNWLATSDVCNGDALNPIQIEWTATDGTHDPANPSQPSVEQSLAHQMLTRPVRSAANAQPRSTQRSLAGF